MKENVSIDRKHNCFRICLAYDDYTITVELVPNVRRQEFEARSVRVEPKISLSAEERVHYETRAVEELLTWFQQSVLRTKLDPVVDRNERIELSFLLTLARWDQEADYPSVMLAPIDYALLASLQRIARELAQQISVHRQHAKSQRRPSGGYFEDIRNRLVQEWAQDIHANEARIAFAKSVLGRAFAWKGGRIPREDYDAAVALRAGARLILRHT